MTRAEKIEKTLSNGGDVTFIFVGDSITFGWHYCTPDETYVAVFASLLAEEYPNASVYRYDGIYESEAHPIHFYEKHEISGGGCGRIHVIRSGVGGNTVARAKARFFNYTGELASGTRSDFIFTMLGINDSIKSDPEKYTDEDTFEARYADLLQSIRDSEPQAELIVMSATTNRGFLEGYIDKTHKICKEKDIPLIDMYALWEAHYEEGRENFGHRDWLLPTDRYHPTPASAKAMGEYVFSEFFK